MKTALITGITGQTGSYLAEFLLSMGYAVHGIMRRSSTFNTGRIDHLYKDPHDPDCKLFLHFADMSDSTSLRTVLEKSRPDEVYNLAAQSHVRVAFEIPEYTFDVTATGVVRLLEAIRQIDLPVRFYQASSSEMFGGSPPPQSEKTQFDPSSQYAVAKVAGYYMTRLYRKAYDMFSCNGILFNHESPRRGETFVTRKITKAAARIKLGLQKELFLGNLEAKRDWGYAGDYVQAIWKMLQMDKPSDYVIATGATHSVREFARLTFEYHGLDYDKYVRFDERYLRPSEVDALCGDASKAKAILGWEPAHTFLDTVHMMARHDYDLELSKAGKSLA